MLAGGPAATRTVDIDGISTSLIEAGDGPPLLLLHGGIECGGRMWAPVITRLARHYRVVAPDVPGLGQSAPVPHLDVDAFGHWLTGVAEHTSLERPTVVAHSLVGSLAARLATRGGSAIGRLIVYAAPGVAPYRMPPRLRYVAIRFAIRPTPRSAERFDRFALLDLDATRQRDPDWYDAFETYTRSRARDPDVKKTMRRLIATQTKPFRTPSSTASTFAPPCCGAATTASSRSQSAKPPHHAMAGPFTSSMAPPTHPTSNNPKHSSTRSQPSRPRPEPTARPLGRRGASRTTDREPAGPTHTSPNARPRTRPCNRRRCIPEVPVGDNTRAAPDLRLLWRPGPPAEHQRTWSRNPAIRVRLCGVGRPAALRTYVCYGRALSRLSGTGSSRLSSNGTTAPPRATNATRPSLSTATRCSTHSSSSSSWSTQQ